MKKNKEGIKANKGHWSCCNKTEYNSAECINKFLVDQMNAKDKEKILVMGGVGYGKTKFIQ